MDGQVGAIRAALDDVGLRRDDHPRLRGEVRERPLRAVPRRGRVEITDGGDRQGYQQDYRNRREALREARADVEQGADIVMVKPAMTYLDVRERPARASSTCPLCAYHVSGEYAMVKAAAANGWIDGPAVAIEQLTAVRRAGADFVLTYFAREVAEELASLSSNEAWFDARAGGHPRRRRLAGPLLSLGRAARPTPSRAATAPTSTDVEGTRYLDFVQSYGASLLGHAASPSSWRRCVDARDLRARPSARRRRVRCCWPKR